MKQRELAELLLRKAAQDITAISRLLPHGDVSDELIGFHAQQAVEKALKAWLVLLGIEPPRVHSLGTLVDSLEAQGHVLPYELRDIIQLSPFATVYRYEHLPLSTDLDRAKFLQLAEGVCTLVATMANPETSP